MTSVKELVRRNLAPLVDDGVGRWGTTEWTTALGATLFACESGETHLVLSERGISYRDANKGQWVDLAFDEIESVRLAHLAQLVGLRPGDAVSFWADTGTYELALPARVYSSIGPVVHRIVSERLR